MWFWTPTKMFKYHVITCLVYSTNPRLGVDTSPPVITVLGTCYWATCGCGNVMCGMLVAHFTKNAFHHNQNSTENPLRRNFIRDYRIVLICVHPNTSELSCHAEYFSAYHISVWKLASNLSTWNSLVNLNPVSHKILMFFWTTTETFHHSYYDQTHIV